MKWIDQYSGNQYKITTTGHHRDRYTARVKNYGDVQRDYEIHPESKYADVTGKPCGKQTIGLLQRRHVRIDEIKYIGKESNSLEEVEAGLIHSEQTAYTIYSDPRRDEWQTKILPALRKLPPELLMKESGKSRSMIYELLAGNSKPHRKNQELLAAIGRKLGMIFLAATPLMSALGDAALIRGIGRHWRNSWAFRGFGKDKAQTDASPTPASSRLFAGLAGALRPDQDVRMVESVSPTASAL